MSSEAIFKVARGVFREWPRRDAKNFNAMSELDVTVNILSFAENPRVCGLQLKISSDKQIFPFRCNMKYLVDCRNTRQSLFATSIADAQKRLELRPEDKDHETIELVT